MPLSPCTRCCSQGREMTAGQGKETDMERDKEREEWDEKSRGSNFGMMVAAFPFLLFLMVDGGLAAVNDFLIDHIGELGTHRFPIAILLLVAMTAGSVIGWRRASKRLGGGTGQ